MLEHRWFLSEQAGHDVGLDIAARAYVDDVLRTNAAFTQAFERILGIAAGSVTLTDEATLRYWFG